MAEVFEFAGVDASQPFSLSPFNWLDPSSLPPSAAAETTPLGGDVSSPVVFGDDDAVSLDSEFSDPQLEVPAAGVDDLPASPPASEPADAGDDEGDAPIVKRRRLEPAVRNNAVLFRLAAARRCAAQMQQAIRNRTLRVRRARPVVPTHPLVQLTLAPNSMLPFFTHFGIACGLSRATKHFSAVTTSTL